MSHDDENIYGDSSIGQCRNMSRLLRRYFFLLERKISLEGLSCDLACTGHLIHPNSLDGRNLTQFSNILRWTMKNSEVRASSLKEKQHVLRTPKMTG
jgi:hypothetical protein